MNSIEWFYNEIKHIIPNDFLNKYEQAKKMHKQNVMNAFNQGHREGWIDGMGLSSDDQDVETFQDAEIYYNETYGSKGCDVTSSQTEKMYSEEDLKKAFLFYAERPIVDIKFLDDDFRYFIELLRQNKKD